MGDGRWASAATVGVQSIERRDDVADFDTVEQSIYAKWHRLENNQDYYGIGSPYKTKVEPIHQSSAYDGIPRCPFSPNVLIASAARLSPRLALS